MGNITKAAFGTYRSILPRTVVSNFLLFACAVLALGRQCLLANNGDFMGQIFRQISALQVFVI